MLFASGNLFECHEEALYLQPLIPPKRFDLFSSITGGCSEGLGALWFFSKKNKIKLKKPHKQQKSSQNTWKKKKKLTKARRNTLNNDKYNNFRNSKNNTGNIFREIVSVDNYYIGETNLL